MGEVIRISRAKKRVLEAMLAEPERTWTSSELASRARSADAVNELVSLLPYLGALEVVEPPSSGNSTRGRRRLRAPGRYRLTGQGPECLRLLLDGARPTGVVATLIREGRRPALDAWLMRRHRRAWRARLLHSRSAGRSGEREGPRESEASPMSYIARRRFSLRGFYAEAGRWRKPPPSA